MLVKLINFLILCGWSMYLDYIEVKGMSSKLNHHYSLWRQHKWFYAFGDVFISHFHVYNLFLGNLNLVMVRMNCCSWQNWIKRSPRSLQSPSPYVLAVKHPQNVILEIKRVIFRFLESAKHIGWDLEVLRQMIDYILVNRCFRNAVKAVKTYLSADSNSDHVFLAGKTKVQWKKWENLQDNL